MDGPIGSSASPESMDLVIAVFKQQASEDGTVDREKFQAALQNLKPDFFNNSTIDKFVSISGASTGDRIDCEIFLRWIFSSGVDGHHLLRLPNHWGTSGEVVELSPFDLLCGGRSVPMLWFYRERLNALALLSALEKTLESYPVLCGRYASPKTVVLSNGGVPVHVCSTAAKFEVATAHLPGFPCGDRQTIFDRAVHEPYVPVKEGMDPDQFRPEAPLLSVKITLFASGGTAVGILAQHAVIDGHAMTMFMRNWSYVFRGLPLSPTPTHNRSAVNALSTGAMELGEKPDVFKIKSVPAGQQLVPEFAGVMPKINGPQVCIVPLSASMVAKFKAEASVGLTADQYMSTDDVVTAHVWRALCMMRIAQIGLPSDSCEVTTCSRACNIRRRTAPPLGDGYCANGVSQVFTDLKVHELLSMTPSTVALRLRASILASTPDVIAAQAQWLLKEQQAECSTKMIFDQKALTFVVSSWGFDWQGANFNAEPAFFDHGAHVPIVSVLSPRPQGDGINVYASGPPESLELFVNTLIK